MRRFTTLILGGLVAALLSAVPSTAAGPHTVSISVRDTTVTVGQKIQFRGQVVPRLSRPVMLQVQRGSGAWRRVQSKDTTSAGKYTFAQKAKTAGAKNYRVCKIGGSAVCSKAVRVRVKKAVTLTSPTITADTVAAYELTTSDSYDIAGTTTADLAGKRIYLQLLNNANSSWASISDPLTVGPNGAFHFHVPARQAGRDLRLRIYAPATETTRSAYADVGPFTVYGWVYVDKLEWVEGDWYEGPAPVNGTTYPRSIYTSSYGNRTGGIDLARKCTTLEATVGLRDDSNSTARESTAVTADSTEIYRLNDIALGQSTPISLDVTGILRLQFSAQDTGGDGYRYLVYGDARVLCAF